MLGQMGRRESSRTARGSAAHSILVAAVAQESPTEWHSRFDNECLTQLSCPSISWLSNDCDIALGALFFCQLHSSVAVLLWPMHIYDNDL